ncbi:MAG: hypothetical protein AAF657_20530 [Acidobacteriota bacterium]
MRDDTWLQEMLAEEPLPDDGFTARVATRLEQQRIRRKWLVVAAALVALCILALGLVMNPAAATGPVPTGAWAVALLVGLGTSCLLWLDTEPVRLRLPSL